MRPTRGGSAARAPGIDRFPALARLAPRSRRRVPVVRQMEAADCGAACVAMVLGYHGRDVGLDDVRQAAGSGRDGAAALALLQAGRRFGLLARGLRLDVDALRHLPPATILHWDFSHWVVFERVDRRGVHLVDPAFGRRLVPMDRFRRAFTGVALSFEPAAGFAATAPGEGRVWAYLRALIGQRHLIGRVVVTSVLLRALALALPILTALVVDRVVPRGDADLLSVVCAGMALALAFQLLSRLIRAHLLLQLRTNLDVRMTLGFLDHLVDLPFGFFQRRSTGDLLMRVSSNTVVRDILTSSTLSALLDGLLAVAHLALIVVIDPALAALSLGIAAIQVSVFLASRRRYRELVSRDLESQARAQSYLVQALSGIETLKIAGAERRAVERWSNLFVDELNVSLSRGRLSALIDAASGVLQAGAPILLLGFGARAVMEGRISLGSMLAVNALAVGLLTPLSALIDAAFQLQQLGSYIERIDDVLSAKPERDRGEAAAPPRLRGGVELQGVSFRYGPHAPLAVRDVSIRVEPGASVAIVGRSGSGKSTLAGMLLGLHAPTEGRISYDGHPLQDLDLREVRRQLGVVPQAPYLFSGPLRDNIALADPTASEERVIAAARRACIHDDIVAMPMGYRTVVADGGASLSGGQRQRIALARALLLDPAILLLDEATSSLDAVSERAVMDSLEAQRCTRIVIAHRLSTIVRADHIIVMDEGRVVETGTHADLMARGGPYRALVAAQAGAGRAEAA